MNVHKTPPTHPKTPPGLVGKMNYCLGKLDPNWAKCLISGPNFSRSGPIKYAEKNIHVFGDIFIHFVKCVISVVCKDEPIGNGVQVWTVQLPY